MLKCWKMSCESQRQPIYVEYYVSAKGCTKEGQKNSRAHKNNIGTSQPPPPPKKNPKYPDLKRGILWAWGFSCRKNQKSQTPIKLAQPFPVPKLRTKNFTNMGIVLRGGGGLFEELGEGGGTGAGRVSGGVCNNCFFFSPSKLPFFRQTVLGNSRGPCYQRDLPMQGFFCLLVVSR